MATSYNRRGGDWSNAPMPGIKRTTTPAHDEVQHGRGIPRYILPPPHIHNPPNPNIFNTPRAAMNSLQQTAQFPRISAPTESWKPNLPRNSRLHGFRDPQRQTQAI